MTAHDVLTSTRARLGRALNITLWVLQGLLAAFFLLAAALPKLLGDSTAVEIFDEIGFGQWFRYFVGVLELAGAVGLVIPRLTRFAALGLAGVMVGAIFTNLFIIDGGLVTITPAILLALLCFIVWGRRPLTDG